MRKYIVVCNICEDPKKKTTTVSIKRGDDRAKAVDLCDEHLAPINSVLADETPQTRRGGRRGSRVTTPDAIEQAKAGANA